MSRWSLTERLQPSLLDRLTDEHPEKTREANYLIGQQELKQAVIRDLAYLMNTVAFDAIEDLERYPEVQRSVLNYGLPDFCGQSASGIDPGEIQSAVARAVRAFEPRIIRNTLKIEVTADAKAMSRNAVVFLVEGAVFGQPAPFQVFLRSQVNLEDGSVNVSEQRG